jgi:hypothetical protein
MPRRSKRSTPRAGPFKGGEKGEREGGRVSITQSTGRSKEKKRTTRATWERALSGLSYSVSSRLAQSKYVRWLAAAVEGRVEV